MWVRGRVVAELPCLEYRSCNSWLGSVFLLDANQPEFTSLRQKEQRSAEESEVDHWNLVSEECKYEKTSKLPYVFTYQALTFPSLCTVKKMRENMDMLLLNQRSQLQVLQEIQKQLNTLLPGNALLNSNVYSLGLLLGQQAAAVASISCPLLNPSSLLSCKGASPSSLSSSSGAQTPASQDPVASAACSALCCECAQCKHMWQFWTVLWLEAGNLWAVVVHLYLWRCWLYTQMQQLIKSLPWSLQGFWLGMTSVEAAQEIVITGVQWSATFMYKIMHQTWGYFLPDMSFSMYLGNCTSPNELKLMIKSSGMI